MSEKRLVTLKIADLESSNYREEGDTKELEISIAKIGQQEPITVESTDGKKYRIKHGHRRVKALRAIGRHEVTAIITDASGDKRKRLVEQIAINNVTKTDSYYLASTVKQLIDEGFSHSEIGEALGRDRAHATRLHGLLIDNAPYTAFVSGRDLLVHKEDKTGSLFFLTKEDIEKAGHKILEFDEIKGLGENAPSIFNCKPLVDVFNDLDKSNFEHLKLFNNSMAFMIKKEIRDKASIASVAMKIKGKISLKTSESKPLDPHHAAVRIVNVLVGAKVDNLKALQKAIRLKLREHKVPYDIIIRHIDEAVSAQENAEK